MWHWLPDAARGGVDWRLDAYRGTHRAQRYRAMARPANRRAQPRNTFRSSSDIGLVRPGRHRRNGQNATAEAINNAGTEKRGGCLCWFDLLKTSPPGGPLPISRRSEPVPCAGAVQLPAAHILRQWSETVAPWRPSTTSSGSRKRARCDRAGSPFAATISSCCRGGCAELAHDASWRVGTHFR